MERFRAQLPAKFRDRLTTYFILAALWPFAPASIAVATLRLMDHLWPGMLMWRQLMVVIIPCAVISGIGSSIILVALPVRFPVRIAVSVAGGLLVLFMFGVWFALVKNALEGLEL